MLQGYLEPEPELAVWRDLTRDGTPLFHAPTLQQIACRAVVGPDGDVLGLPCTMVEMVMSRCERTYHLDEAGIADVARRYVDAFAGKGWVGMLNLQGRRDPGGTFRVYRRPPRFE